MSERGRTLQTIPLLEDPGMRAATMVSWARHSSDVRKPGLASIGCRRGGILFAGRLRGL
jgi:hypothetical protein